MQILLIEDDIRLVEHLTEAFRIHGLFTCHISSEKDLTAKLRDFADIDAIILDRLLGAFDTKDILPALRKQFPQTPIVILSAINTPNERTELINLGADDYMGKPFATFELIARLKAMTRRAPAQNLNLKIGNVVVDTLNRTITVDSEIATLPAKEFSVLRTLSKQVGRVWSKSELLDSIWGQNAEVETNVVEATIANLRKKLGLIGAKLEIKNMRNAGYWIEE